MLKRMMVVLFLAVLFLPAGCGDVGGLLGGNSISYDINVTVPAPAGSEFVQEPMSITICVASGPHSGKVTDTTDVGSDPSQSSEEAVSDSDSSTGHSHDSHSSPSSSESSLTSPGTSSTGS